MLRPSASLSSRSTDDDQLFDTELLLSVDVVDFSAMYHDKSHHHRFVKHMPLQAQNLAAFDQSRCSVISASRYHASFCMGCRRIRQVLFSVCML